MPVSHKLQASKKKNSWKKKRAKATAPQVDVEVVQGEEAEEPLPPQRHVAVAVVSLSALFTLTSIYVAQFWRASPDDSLGLVLSGPQQNASVNARDKLSLSYGGSLGAAVAAMGAPSGAIPESSKYDGLLQVQDSQQPAPAPVTTVISQARISPRAAGTQTRLRLAHISPRQPGNFRQPRVLWIHLHGYGGTTICDMARSQGEKVPRAQDNCNVMPDLCSTPKIFRTPCTKRASSLQYTFTAIERAVDEDDLSCSGGAASSPGATMLYGAMLRDPLSGIKSTWIGNELEKDLILAAIKTKTRPRNFQYHFCLPPSDTYQHFDNFAVRTLSGDYDVAPGEVTSRHLERAKEVLSRLDVVLILEHLVDHLPQLHAIFGWDLMMDNPWRSHRHRIPKNAMSPGEEMFLKKVNAWDYELYEFGKELALERTAQAKLRLLPS